MKQSKLLKSIFLALLLSASALTASAYDFMVDGLCYNITSDNTVEVTYLQNNSTTNYSGLNVADIPDSVIYEDNTYKVTKVGYGAFYCVNYSSTPNSSLHYVNIPRTVKSIEANAFLACPLYDLYIPNSVESLGGFCFGNIRTLSSVRIPQSVKTIGDSFFDNGNFNPTFELTLCGDLQIGDEAFQYMRNGAGTRYGRVTKLFLGKDVPQIKNLGVDPSHIYSYSLTPPECDDNSFLNYSGTLHVPADAIADYFLLLTGQTLQILLVMQFLQKS